MNVAAKKIASARPDLMPLEFLRSAAECLKCVAHPHRLRIIEILFQGKYPVDKIASLCDLSQPATSGHLRLMEGKGLLKSTREGRVVYYTVAEPQLEGIIDCVRGRYAGIRDRE
jgi:ArsR family transcriptional regulator, zinc-responsive transcriptional repressor